MRDLIVFQSPRYKHPQVCNRELTRWYADGECPYHKAKAGHGSKAHWHAHYDQADVREIPPECRARLEVLWAERNELAKRIDAEAQRAFVLGEPLQPPEASPHQPRTGDRNA